MKYASLLIIAAFCAPAAAVSAQESSADWNATSRAVDERTSEIDSFVKEVNAILDEYRGSPDFEKRAELWNDYLTAHIAWQVADPAGKDADELQRLRGPVDAAKTVLEKAVGDSELLRRINLKLAQGIKIVDSQSSARIALAAAARVLREAKLTTDRIADLQKERDNLADRIEKAKVFVAGLKDEELRNSNLKLVAMAVAELKTMDKSLLELRALAAKKNAELARLAGDPQAAAALAGKIAASRDRWNDAKLRMDEALAAIRQFTQVGSLRAGEIVGDVKIRRADGTFVDAKADIPLRPGDVIQCGPKSRATVVLADESRVAVSQNSSFALAAPEGSNTGETLDFKSGAVRYLNSFHEGVGKAAYLFKRQLNRRHAVQTPTCPSAVKGCDMVVFVTDEEVRVCIAHGEFILCHRQGEVVLGGNEITITAGTLETAIKPMAPEAYRKLLVETFPDVE